MLALASSHFSHHLALRPAIPHFLPVICVFSIAIIALSQASTGVFVNSLVARLGKVSFSAYLLHCSVLDWVVRKNPIFFNLKAAGVPAIAVFLGAYATVVIVTYPASSLTYRFVKLPMMNFARPLTQTKPVLAASFRP